MIKCRLNSGYYVLYAGVRHVWKSGLIQSLDIFLCFVQSVKMKRWLTFNNLQYQLSKSQTHRRRADNKQNFWAAVIGSFFDNRIYLPHDGKRKKAVVTQILWHAFLWNGGFEKSKPPFFFWTGGGGIKEVLPCPLLFSIRCLTVTYQKKPDHRREPLYPWLWTV